MQERFSFEQFTNLMKQSPAKAFAYRDRMKTGEVVAEEVVSPVAEVLETKEITIDRAGMKELLINASIEFKGNASNATLLELIKVNGLI